MPENHDIELRSEEVQEIMNRIPPAIQHWGITVLALIVSIFFAIAYFVEIPVTVDCKFTINTNEGKSIIFLSPSALQSLQSNDTVTARLQSDMFPSEYSSGIPIFINENQISLNSEGEYEAVFKMLPEMESYLFRKDLTICGTATIIVAHKTLFDTFNLDILKSNSE